MAEFIPRFLRQLRDVVLSSPADGEVLTYDIGSEKWVNAPSVGGSGGAPTDIDYLVGTASGSLSAEIAVGTTPGGELGGTWASPTVDATHSGSSHAGVQAAAEATAAAALSGHVNDTTAAHAASAISADSTTLVGVGTDVQAVLEELDNGIADHLADTSAAHAASAISVTPTGAIAATDAQAALAELDSEKQPVNAGLTAIAGLDSATAGMIASDGAGWIKKTYAQVKTALSLTKSDVGLGNVTNDAQLKASQLDTDGTLAANSDTAVASQKAVKTYVGASVGSIPTDYVAKATYDANTVLAADTDNTPAALTMGASTILARLAAGNIKAASTSEIRTLLGLVIGTNVQAWDADLDAIAALTSAADKMPYSTAAQTWALATLTSYARTLLDDADAAAARTTLGVAANDGWVDDTAATWTYASATTFTVPGDLTARFKKGTLLKLTQTTVKYFIVASSSYSAPNTTVTIVENLDYVLANAAISANYYSYAANPQGWPGWFHYTSTLTGWASTPSVTAQFAVCGMVCYVRIGVGSGGYSGTTVTFTLPIVSHATVGNTYHPFRGVNNSSTLTTPASAQPRSNSNVCDVYKDFSDAAWTASGNRSLYGNVWYPL